MKKIHSAEVNCLLILTAKKGREKQLKKALEALISPTHQESGCLMYELWEDANDSGKFILFERFSSQEALDEHIKQPYVQNFIHHEWIECVENRIDLDIHPIAGRK